MPTDFDARVTPDPIDVAALVAAAPGSGDGAIVLFVGRVRDTNEGRPVSGLVYEAYVEMAEAEMARIAGIARDRWPVGALRVRHRVGELELGDVAVAIVVTSPHRAEAFEAARFVIDEVKARVPIWKHERYADGATRWVGGAVPVTTAE